MAKILIKGYIKNLNLNETTIFNEVGIFCKNCIIFNCDNNKYKIKLSEKIITLFKENSESKLNIKYAINNTTLATYTIKQYNSNFSFKVDTKSIENNSNDILIKYNMYLSDVDITNYELKINYEVI